MEKEYIIKLINEELKLIDIDVLKKIYDLVFIIRLREQ